MTQDHGAKGEKAISDLNTDIWKQSSRALFFFFPTLAYVSVRVISASLVLHCINDTFFDLSLGRARCPCQVLIVPRGKTKMICLNRVQMRLRVVYAKSTYQEAQWKS